MDFKLILWLVLCKRKGSNHDLKVTALLAIQNVYQRALVHWVQLKTGSNRFKTNTLKHKKRIIKSIFVPSSP